MRAPRIYFRDSGPLRSLLSVRDETGPLTHPRSGASREGFMPKQVLRAARPDEACFRATHAGAELDLLMLKHGRRIGVEVKRADAPGITPSMRTALRELRLDRLLVLYPGSRHDRLADSIDGVPAAAGAGFVP